MPATLTFAADSYAPRTRHAAHRHDALHLSLVLGGRVAETVGATTEVAGPLSVVAKDAGVVHADDFGAGGARLARLTLPSGTLGALVDEPARAGGWRWTHDPAVAAPFLRLVVRAGGGPASYAADDADLLDLLAAVTARPATAARGTPPAWLADVVRDLRDSWTPATTVADVARRAGVHPVYLARCVRRWYGTGVAEELRRLRLRSAVAATLERRRTLAEIAHAHGYADEPHLCRDLRRATGLTPGRYRALVDALACRTA